MTNIQDARFNMYLALRDWQVNYTTITNALPNYSANSTTLINIIPQIQAVSEQQRTSKRGISGNKNLLKKNLIVLAADTARKLNTYATFSNNLVLVAEIGFSEGKLSKLSDLEIKDAAQLIYDRAQPIIGNLAPYLITQATQTALLAAITAFNASIGKPKAGKADGAQLTKQLASLFETADAAINNMDLAVEIVRSSQPNFYNGYKSVRKVMVRGTSSLSIKGLVSDAKTGDRLKGVTVIFSSDSALKQDKAGASSGQMDVVLEKRTADKGGFSVKSIPAGTYMVTIKKAGYVEQVTTVSVNDGEMSDLVVALEKN